MNIRLVISNYLQQIIIPNWKLFNFLIRGYNGFDKLREIIIQLTPKLNDIPRKFTQRIEWIINNRKDFPKCKYCHTPQTKKRDFISIHQGYRPTCGRKECGNASSSETSNRWWSNMTEEKIKDRSNKMIETKIKNGIPLGGDKEKAANTYFLKTGYRNPSQNPKVKEKKRQTCKSNYGVDMYMYSEEFKREFHKRENQKIYDKLKKDKYVEFLSNIEDIHCEDRKTIYKWKCKECGHEFEDHIDYGWYSHGAIRSYARCPKCYPKEHASSVPEKELFKFLKDNVKGYIIHTNENINRHTIECGHLDIILENEITRKIDFAFEFNGLYWHQNTKKQFNENYHYDKTVQCENKGIRLRHIWEDEWFQNEEKVKRDVLDYINGKQVFEESEIITVDRSIFCKLIIPKGYHLVSESKPSLITKTDGYSNYEIYDCGTLTYARSK